MHKKTWLAFLLKHHSKWGGARRQYSFYTAFPWAVEWFDVINLHSLKHTKGWLIETLTMLLEAAIVKQ